MYMKILPEQFSIAKICLSSMAYCCNILYILVGWERKRQFAYKHCVHIKNHICMRLLNILHYKNVSQLKINHRHLTTECITGNAKKTHKNSLDFGISLRRPFIYKNILLSVWAKQIQRFIFWIRNKSRAFVCNLCRCIYGFSFLRVDVFWNFTVPTLYRTNLWYFAVYLSC